MSSFFKVKLQLPGLAILALLQFEQSMPAIAEVVVQPSGAAQSALVEKRDAETLRKDGEALIYVPDPSLRNVTAGVDLLQQSADSGNVKAMLTLGSLYLYGGALPASRATALKYFERAAAAGDSSGMAQYGMMLMWSESDWSRAQKMLTRAGEDGDASAWTTLAEGAMYGYLGGGRYSRAKLPRRAQQGVRGSRCWKRHGKCGAYRCALMEVPQWPHCATLRTRAMSMRQSS